MKVERRFIFLVAIVIAIYSGSSLSSTKSLTIKDAVDFWTLEGKTYDILTTCDFKISGNQRMQIAHVSGQSCNISELAVYMLKKECYEKPNTPTRIVIEAEAATSIEFVTTKNNCNLLVNSSESISNFSEQSYAPPALNKKKGLYTLQFFSGNSLPNLSQLNCVHLRLQQRQIKDKFYVFSGVYDSYQKAKMSIKEINQLCPHIPVWIRPLD
ncbi:hypothetical protein CGI23_25415 [Vibrio parahaemolyticus]|uniref:hypothetical protein n=1 Tax=Vibrio parahaemolyticus TaxID=670 RepID=UPI0011208FE4|nr:hypothetical protein [Vibrio parahaemolyticus]TOK17385.1 hypothetical protein CGI23_25415 [Vibrio parahaemolyticus]